MKKMNFGKKQGIERSRFPLAVFWIIFLSVLVMSGIHTALYLLLQKLDISPILETHMILFYWILVALGLTAYIRLQVKKTYEEPLKNMSEATKKVAKGDFSVYIPTINTADDLDYLDMMILDMNKMIEELGSIETLKTDFISNVSHEMKTPLSVIKNYAEMLQMSSVTEERRLEYARSIEETAGKMSDLISNILKLNKLENQRIVPKPEVYDVCRQLCDCILGFEAAWENKDIEMEVDIADFAFVKADESLMELVWNNLLSNAVKFTDPGGTIIVKQQFEKNMVKVSVTDTGCGIDPENIKHVFDKFYQGDTSRATEGNGLGLALVHRVLMLTDGEIQVVSETGIGSTFTVILPVAETDNHHTPEETYE